tara:strand:+ start:91250 stop:92365 length:1116 start_codon:yes stop_codon:yes gene_type:complete
MKKRCLNLLTTLSAVVALATTAEVATAQDTSQLPRVVEQPVGEPRTVRPVQKRVEGLRDMILLDDPYNVKAVKKIELGRFWIGLNCAEVSPALRSQLKLQGGIGLLVVNAFEGSPSQKAGLQQHDVVVRAGDTDIGAVGQLIDAVQKAGKSELKLGIIREGQPKTITVKSAERPKEQQGNFIYLPGTGGEHRLLLQTPEGAFTFVEPGIVLDNRPNLPATRTIDRRLPAGVSITVKRKAGEPASIHVERDNKTWDISADQLDQLPEDLRPHVQAMLAPVPTKEFPPNYSPHRSGTDRLRNKLPGTAIPQTGPVIPFPKFMPLNDGVFQGNDGPNSASKVESEIEKLKRELSEEIKQLRQAINELKKSNEAN